MNRRSAAVMNWRNRTKMKLVEYKGGKCELCGYCKEIPAAFHFHHVDPEKKDFNVSGCSRKFESLLEEVKKCQLLCGNCHAEVHWVLDKQNREARQTSVTATRLQDAECPKCKKRFKPASNRIKYCSVECAKLNQRRSTRPDQEQLRRDVEELGWCGAGRKYGVSDNAIRKWLK